MVLTRLREYWEMENLDFTNFTEVDINSLGTFLRGLAQEELKKLPEKILLTAIRRLGEQTGLPEDKLKARAYLAVELFKVINALSSFFLGENRMRVLSLVKAAAVPQEESPISSCFELRQDHRCFPGGRKPHLPSRFDRSSSLRYSWCPLVRGISICPR